jgi:hypothetical protein
MDVTKVYSGKLDVREAAVNLPDMVEESEAIDDNDTLTEEAVEKISKRSPKRPKHDD